VTGSRAATCIVLGLALMAVYLANGRTIGAGDTVPNTLLAASLADGKGLFLDRYRPSIAGRTMPYWATERHGHLVSVYPVAPAIMAAPFFLLQMKTLDLLRPGWRTHGFPTVFVLGKNVAALFAAASGVVLYLLLKGQVSTGALWATMAAAMLGSEMWMVASQSLWPHGPSVLALASALLIVRRGPASRARLLMAGMAGGAVLACRIPSAIYVAALLAWLLVRDGRRAGWFLLGLLPVTGLAVAYNVAWFDGWQGGIALLEARKPITHAVEAPWSANVLAGAAGTLLSPNRGLFVFCPWVAMAAVTLPFYWRRLAGHPPAAVLVVSLVPSLLILSAYSTWWAGWSFGPRFWTDATPIFAIMLAVCLDWARERPRTLRRTIHAGIVVAVTIQAIGAICYPSSWNGHPTNVDQDHRRLWDWYDTELSRCVREGPHPAAFRPSSRDAGNCIYGIVRSPRS